MTTNPNEHNPQIPNTLPNEFSEWERFRSELVGLFCSRLFEDGDWIEFRAIPNGNNGRPRSMRRQWPIDEAGYEALAQWARPFLQPVRESSGDEPLYLGVYAGVAPRMQRYGSGRGGHHTDDDVAPRFRALYVDDDNRSAQQLADHIRACGVATPSMLIDSGRGAHAYWILNEAIVEPDTFRAAQRALIAKLGTDRKIHNPSRVMRVPGTMHTKRNKLCAFVSHDGPNYADYCAVGISDDDLLPYADRVEAPTGTTNERGLDGIPQASRVWLEQEDAEHEGGGPYGGRNNSTFQVACELKASGVAFDDALSMLLRVADRDGLPKREARGCVRRAYSQERTIADRAEHFPSLAELADSLNGAAGRVQSTTQADDEDEDDEASNTAAAEVVSEWNEQVAPDAYDTELANAVASIDFADFVATPTSFEAAGLKREVDEETGFGRKHISFATEVVEGQGSNKRKVWVAKPIERTGSQTLDALDSWPRYSTEYGLYFLERVPDRSLLRVRACYDKEDKFESVVKERTTFSVPPPNATVYVEHGGARRRAKGYKLRDLMHYLCEHLPQDEAVEVLPHEPKIPGVYYIPNKRKRATGKRLAQLIDALNPATDVDLWLLLALLMTPGWGGKPGRRPLFVLTSDYSQGAGKTTTAHIVGEVWGGHANLDSERSWADNMRAHMSSADIGTRVFLFDNVRGKLSGSAIEAAVTSKTIEGHRMYVGLVKRPNTTTTLVTYNDPVMSRDMAERSVVIQLGKARGDQGFGVWLSNFLEEHSDEVREDLLALLARDREVDLPAGFSSRWGDWFRNVLARVPGVDLQQVAQHMEIMRDEVDESSQGEFDDMCDEVSAWLRTKDRHVDTNGKSVVSSSELCALAISCGIFREDDNKSEQWNRQRAMSLVKKALGGAGGVLTPDRAGTGKVRKGAVDAEGCPVSGAHDVPGTKRSALYLWSWGRVHERTGTDWLRVAPGAAQAACRRASDSTGSLAGF